MLCSIVRQKLPLDMQRFSLKIGTQAINKTFQVHEQIEMPRAFSLKGQQDGAKTPVNFWERIRTDSLNAGCAWRQRKDNMPPEVLRGTTGARAQGWELPEATPCAGAAPRGRMGGWAVLAAQAKLVQTSPICLAAIVGTNQALPSAVSTLDSGWCQTSPKIRACLGGGGGGGLRSPRLIVRVVEGEVEMCALVRAW